MQKNIRMKIIKATEPNYDFEVIELSNNELKDMCIFTSEVAIYKCIKGNAIISINSSIHKFATSNNFILFDAMNLKVVECSEDIQVIVCRFSVQFLNEIYAVLDNKIIDTLWYSTPDMYAQQEAESINLTFDKLCLLHKNTNLMYRHKIAINLLLCYIYEMYELIHPHVESRVVNTGNYVNFILDKFCLSCHKNHKTERNVAFYAKELGISSRYLSKITKSAFASTPKQVIDYYVSGTAKILLLSTTLTNQQIADQLNFPDQATFGQFFKRNVGMPPTEFRNKYK